MRKILLATTALIGLITASAAQAATTSAPVTVNVGGDVDVLAGFYHEAAKTLPVGADRSANDFETLYDLDFNIVGKTGNGIQYGGTLSLNNTPDISNNFNGQSNGIEVTTADIFMSGAFGKLQLGDSHGATDLAVMAPTVGEGQVEGRYIDFLDTNTYAKNLVVGVDSTDHSTNITYFTPKVGFDDNNKFQVAASYLPNFYNYGSNVDQVTNTVGTGGSNALSPYKQVFKGAVAYEGNLSPVSLKASAHVITGTSDIGSPTSTAVVGGTTFMTNPLWMAFAPAGGVQDFTSWGLGAQGAFEGFTLGGSYTDMGHYNTVSTQKKDQNQYTAGIKYEFNKYAVGASYLGGEGYGNMLTGTAAQGATSTAATSSAFNYVKDFNSYALGGAYSWAPGLTTNLDGVMFQQKTDAGVQNDGYVLLVSQKLAF